MTTFGERVRQRREELNLRQVDLADLSGLTQATLSAIETGKIKSPRGILIGKLATALEISTDHLIENQVVEK